MPTTPDPQRGPSGRDFDACAYAVTFEPTTVIFEGLPEKHRLCEYSSGVENVKISFSSGQEHRFYIYAHVETALGATRIQYSVQGYPKRDSF